MVVSVALTVIAVIVVAGLQGYTSIGQRFLPVSQVMIFLIAVCGNVVIGGWATYMRAHKREPMLLLSLIGAFLIGGSTIFLGMRFSTMGMAVGYCLITLIYGIPSVYILWQQFKRRYHDAYEGL